MSLASGVDWATGSTTGIRFFVQGEPRPKQSFRIGGAGQGGHGYQPARVKAWQAEVGWAAMQMMRDAGFVAPITGRVAVTLTFHLGDCRRVDLDNLSKGTLDAMNGVVWADDQQIVMLHLTKRAPSAEPGVQVLIEICGENE